MKVEFDSRALLLDGRRTLILSGAIHYPRSTPAMWPALMRASRAAGLNTIETYVFWNLHERERGLYDFSGRLDLPRFCQLAQEHGLHVILRIGPYICAETNYGGLPAWLREVPGIQMRTENAPFQAEMQKWVRTLCTLLRPLFAPFGGPIILGQVENEYDNIAATYGAAGQRYLQWSVEFAQSLQLGVPWLTCLAGDVAEMGKLDASLETHAAGSLVTLNGFRAHLLIEKHRAKHPGQPALWTENWPGWYQTWASAPRVRDPREIAYAVARFFAAGGAGVNYYMWHGGTNFGREAMFLQTTSYDFGAALDEFGQPTIKSRHLAALHRALAARADNLLAHERATAQPLGAQQTAFSYGTRLAFLCNDDASTSATVRFRDRDHILAPLSVLVLDGDEVAYNSAKLPRAIARAWKSAGVRLAPFVSRAEPPPTAWPEALQSPITACAPIEQLSLTRDTTDYCWYETEFTVTAREAGDSRLTLERVADLAHLFIDGKLCATTSTPISERRGRPDSDKFSQHFTLRLSPGRHRLSILCCAVGLIKGDWMLGGANMVAERKGLWGAVRWRDRVLSAAWRMQPGLLGERVGLFADAGELLAWKPAHAKATSTPLTWWRTSFARPKRHAALALDLRGMTKGLAWLNGRCLGRYWLIAGTLPVEPWNQWMKTSIAAEPTGEPTQRYYHLPAEWLRTRNTLVLFDELGGNPSSIRLVHRT